MTGLNHAVTGVFVVVAVSQPALALPAALLSHFVIDALPHYDHKDLLPNLKKYKLVLVFDALLSFGLLTFFAFILDEPAWLIFAGGFLAIAPDLMWLPAITKGKTAPRDQDSLLHLIRRFHAWVQWSEGPRGLYIEIIWFVLMLILIWTIG
jgi:hypothetical protein